MTHEIEGKTRSNSPAPGRRRPRAEIPAPKGPTVTAKPILPGLRPRRQYSRLKQDHESTRRGPGNGCCSAGARPPTAPRRAGPGRRQEGRRHLRSTPGHRAPRHRGTQAGTKAGSHAPGPPERVVLRPAAVAVAVEVDPPRLPRREHPIGPRSGRQSRRTVLVRPGGGGRRDDLPGGPGGLLLLPTRRQITCAPNSTDVYRYHPMLWIHSRWAAGISLTNQSAGAAWASSGAGTTGRRARSTRSRSYDRNTHATRWLSDASCANAPLWSRCGTPTSWRCTT
jgi:hypothetical protein